VLDEQAAAFPVPVRDQIDFRRFFPSEPQFVLKSDLSGAPGTVGVPHVVFQLVDRRQDEARSYRFAVCVGDASSMDVEDSVGRADAGVAVGSAQVTGRRENFGDSPSTLPRLHLLRNRRKMLVRDLVHLRTPNPARRMPLGKARASDDPWCCFEPRAGRVALFAPSTRLMISYESPS
jgi:hypothetical protein